MPAVDLGFEMLQIAMVVTNGPPHKRPRHARIAPLVGGVVLGLGVNIFRPRGIVLEGRDRADARRVCAEAVDHGPAILADQAGAQLIPAPHRPPVRDAGVICGVKWPQTSCNEFLVDPLRNRGPSVLLEARGIEHPITESGVVEFALDDPAPTASAVILSPTFGAAAPYRSRYGYRPDRCTWHTEALADAAPEQLLSALLLQVFYGIRSERQLLEGDKPMASFLRSS